MQDLPSARIIRSNRKTIALIIDADGALIVRAPLKLSKKKLEQILREKQDWITTRQREILNHKGNRQPHQYREGEIFWYLGAQFPLRITQAHEQPIMLGTHFSLNQKYLPEAAKVFENWYRIQARQVLTKRLDQVARQFGFTYPRFRLSSARTRWGSCSSKGTISLVWRLVMAPIPVIDYVALHELMHLRIHNHSRAFWEQIAQTNPDFRAHITWLKEHGHQLFL